MVHQESVNRGLQHRNHPFKTQCFGFIQWIKAIIRQLRNKYFALIHYKIVRGDMFHNEFTTIQSSQTQTVKRFRKC